MRNADPTMPLTELKLGNDVFHLVFDLDAIAEAEDLTDRPLLLGLQQRDVTSPTISLVRAMFLAGLRRHQGQMTVGDVRELVTRKNLREIWEKVLVAYVLFCAEDPKEGEENPPEPEGPTG